jgi:hypothetical protein
MRTLSLGAGGGCFGCCCCCLLPLGVPPPSRTHTESARGPLDCTCWGPLVWISCCSSCDGSFWEALTSLLVRLMTAEVNWSSEVGVHERLQGRSGGPAPFTPAAEDMGPSPFRGTMRWGSSPGMVVHSILPDGAVPYRGYNQYRNATPKTHITFVI